MQSGRLDLGNLNLIIGNEKDTATNAYAILLGKHDYTSRIQCVRFRGTERVDFPDKKEYELPHKAIRELTINAVIHRNYKISSSVQVAVYDDRVEISSPGTNYASLTLEEAMEGRSSIRNKTLARTLEKIDMLEGWGSGLKRIFHNVKSMTFLILYLLKLEICSESIFIVRHTKISAINRR